MRTAYRVLVVFICFLGVGSSLVCSKQSEVICNTYLNDKIGNDSILQPIEFAYYISSGGRELIWLLGGDNTPWQAEFHSIGGGDKPTLDHFTGLKALPDSELPGVFSPKLMATEQGLLIAMGSSIYEVKALDGAAEDGKEQEPGVYKVGVPIHSLDRYAFDEMECLIVGGSEGLGFAEYPPKRSIQGRVLEHGLSYVNELGTEAHFPPVHTTAVHGSRLAFYAPKRGIYLVDLDSDSCGIQSGSLFKLKGLPRGRVKDFAVGANLVHILFEDGRLYSYPTRPTTESIFTHVVVDETTDRITELFPLKKGGLLARDGLNIVHLGAGGEIVGKYTLKGVTDEMETTFFFENESNAVLLSGSCIFPIDTTDPKGGCEGS